MDGRQGQGGYERTSGGFGSDFISLGSDSGPDKSNKRWRPWNRRGRGRGSHQTFNRFERFGEPSEVSTPPFYSNPHPMEGQNRGSGNRNSWGHQEQLGEGSTPPFYSNPHPMERQNRGSGNQNSWGHQEQLGEGSTPPFYSNPHPMRGQNRGRGNQNSWGHQGPRQPKYPKGSDIPISAYYHPSMLQDPWEALENLLKGPKIEAPSGDVQCDDSDQVTGEIDDLNMKGPKVEAPSSDMQCDDSDQVMGEIDDLERPNSGDSEDSE